MAQHTLFVRSTLATALASATLVSVSCARNPAPEQQPASATVASMPPRPAPVPLPAPSTRAAPFDPRTPLTPAQTKWIDSTLASLPLRDRIGQMVTVWVLGDYTSNGDSSFAEVRRWIERDHVGGVSMSLGTPIEVAAKINSMQRISRVPLIASADLEPGLGRLEGVGQEIQIVGAQQMRLVSMEIGAQTVPARSGQAGIGDWVPVPVQTQFVEGCVVGLPVGLSFLVVEDVAVMNVEHGGLLGSMHRS